MRMKTVVKNASRQIMELKDLISGPLVATIDADSISARRYLSYFYELAFDSYNHVTGEVGNLRMLEFTYSVQEGRVTQQKKASIPLMTLVPLPLLQVKEADFDFDIQIIDALDPDDHSTFSLRDRGDNAAPKQEGVKLRVSMAASRIEGDAESKARQGLAANMKVKVKMRQADMPGGLSNLLNLATNNLQVADVVEDKEEPQKNE